MDSESGPISATEALNRHHDDSGLGASGKSAPGDCFVSCVRSRLLRMAEILYLFALPLIAFVGMHFRSRFQNHMIDPYIYTGYINNFADLFHRFGMRYFGVRFGLILPAKFTTWLFGPELGYFVLRYVLALIFGMSVYVLCKQYLSVPVAVLMYGVSLTNPFLARILLWDYPDATGVPFLMAAICLVMLEQRRFKRGWDFLAGFCAAMAIHSNIFTASILAIFVATYAALVFKFGKNKRSLAWRFAWMSAGIITVTLLGSLYYWLTVGHFDIFTVTLKTGAHLAGGGMNQWRPEGMRWMASQYHVLLPVWLVLCCWAVIPRRSFVGLLVATFGTAVTASYYVSQFVLHADFLNLFYYFSYLAPAIFLMLAVVFQSLWETGSIHRVVFVGGGLVTICMPWWLLWYEFDPSRARTLQFFCEIAALAIGALVLALRWPGGVTKRILAVAAIALLAVSFDSGISTYWFVIRWRNHPDPLEDSVYRVALQFIRAVPPFRSKYDSILFWYRADPDDPLQSIQSTYLWTASRLDVSNVQRIDVLSPAELEKLKRVGYLGLLANSNADLGTETATLTSYGVKYRVADRRQLASGNYRIQWELLEFPDVEAGLGHLANGDFEAGTDPWIAGFASLRSVDGGQSGKCLELDANAGKIQFAVDWQAVDLRVGRRYRMTFWVKSGTSGDGPFRVGLWNNDNRDWMAYREGRSSPTWTQYSFDFTNVAPGTLALQLVKESSTRGSMLFDSLQVRPLP